MTIRQIGIDIGKSTFHAIGLGPDDAIVPRKVFTRPQVIPFVETHAGGPFDIAFEACSAHWLAHGLLAMGRRVRLLTPESVRRFAKAQKNDRNDALAAPKRCGGPAWHAVGTKSEERLDMQALHRVRQRPVTARTPSSSNCVASCASAASSFPPAGTASSATCASAVSRRRNSAGRVRELLACGSDGR
jgi:transposase